MPPELTAFGRRFKLSGYTLTTRPPLVNDIDDHKKNTLWLTDMPGVAILAQKGLRPLRPGAAGYRQSLSRPRAKRYISVPGSVQPGVRGSRLG